MNLMNNDWKRISKGIIISGSDEQVPAEGLYRGGDMIVERLLPEWTILPHCIEDIIRAGIHSLSSKALPLLKPSQVAERLFQAAKERSGLSVIRLGDGELLTLAQGTVLSDDEVQIAGHFLKRAGVCLPDYHTRDRLAEAIVKADIVGVPTARRPTFQGLFQKLADYYQWPLRDMCLTTSRINTEMDKHPEIIRKLFTNYRIILVGNVMSEVSEMLLAAGYHCVVGVIPVAGVSSVEAVLRKIGKYTFDIALVSAGVAAEIICTEISAKGKVGFDLGHIANKMIKRGHVIP